MLMRKIYTRYSKFDLEKEIWCVQWYGNFNPESIHSLLQKRKLINSCKPIKTYWWFIGFSRWIFIWWVSFNWVLQLFNLYYILHSLAANFSSNLEPIR